MDAWLKSTPIAHRGLHDQRAPENSLAAFRAAAHAGFAIELDIFLAADHQLVVIHDENTLRLTGNNLDVVGTDSSILRKLEIEGSGETVPMLSEALLEVAGKTPILVEIKTASPMPATGEALVSLLEHYHGEIAIQSFDPRILLWFHRNAPQITRGQLCAASQGTVPGLLRRQILRTMVMNFVTRPNFISYDLDGLPSGVVRFWSTFLRIPVIAWTVNTDDRMAKARQYANNMIFEAVRPELSIQAHY